MATCSLRHVVYDTDSGDGELYAPSLVVPVVGKTTYLAKQVHLTGTPGDLHKFLPMGRLCQGTSSGECDTANTVGALSGYCSIEPPFSSGRYCGYN